MHLTPLKRCAHWTVNSKINSAWKGSYLCFWWQTLSDRWERYNQQSAIPTLSHSYPNNLSLYSPSSFLLSREVQFLPSTQPNLVIYNYQSQPQKTGVYPDEKKQKAAFKSTAQPVGGTASTDLRVMQGQGMECTEYSPHGRDWWAVEMPQELLPCLVGTQSTRTMACPLNSLLPTDIGTPLPSAHLNHHDF